MIFVQRTSCAKDILFLIGGRTRETVHMLVQTAARRLWRRGTCCVICVSTLQKAVRGAVVVAVQRRPSHPLHPKDMRWCRLRHMAWWYRPLIISNITHHPLPYSPTPHIRPWLYPRRTAYWPRIEETLSLLYCSIT